MPVLASCVSSAVESPPRKKFKFSLKLKKKKAKGKNPMDSDSENDSGKEDSGNTHNCEAKGDLNSSSTKTTMSLTDEYTSFGLLTETVTPPLPYTGLANLGNTCYLNAVLQVLRYCPGFLRSLVNLDDISSQKDCTIAAYLVRMFYIFCARYYHKLIAVTQVTSVHGNFWQSVIQKISGKVWG